jgi:putative transposase
MFGIAKSTFYQYYTLISKGNLLEKIHSEIVTGYASDVPVDFLITDTFTVKSMNGSEGLGRNPTDRGRKGLKVSLICDQNLVTHAVSLSPANCHDSKILSETILASITNIKGIKCLADSGYSGSKYLSEIHRTTLVSKPRRTRNHAKMSHLITEPDRLLLEKKRNYIERLNGNIRNFRGLMIKYSKSISTYKTLLFVSLLCISCYMIGIFS